jgi:hypothetical protein
MGDVKRLHNSLVLDADFVSELWATLRDKEGSLSPEKLSELIALKMYDQDCGFSSVVLDNIGGPQTSDEIISEWAKPIKDRMKELEKANG